ncbi:hypothetical protein Nepgr_016058 [Nepenthes gracilis]|uniref:DUF4220 domain-containing protein n=1 Tax=Nepenthes gracilis TaxID=150966 RepID=A0AAD3XQY3_NEPGR|nr:hypothetical protein Nepgr_016058 [Nepenthes gracilis]
MQTFLENIGQLWNAWEIHVIVSISLFLQILLMLFGRKRKYIPSVWISILVWITYVSADWFAMTSLGALLRNKAEDGHHNENFTLQAFWAPFLLLHLCGRNTITAYSLEDNELWLRRLLELAVQVMIAAYVCIISLRFTHNVIAFLAILVFIAGLIKYCERVWALWFASYGHFQASLLPLPDPGPDYAKFMEEYTRGNERSFIKLIEPPYMWVDNSTDDATFIRNAHHLFGMLRRIYAGYILDFNEQGISQGIFGGKSPTQVFKLIEFELGFMYDALYTKATVIYSPLGILLRSVSLLCIISAFSVFCVLVDQQSYSRTDMTITYVLLGGAIVLEIYAAILLFFSDWTVLWLTKHDKSRRNSIFRAISPIWSCLNQRKRWSRSIAQHNLLTNCLEAKRHPVFERAFKFVGIFDMFIAYKCRTWQDISLRLKAIVTEYINQRPKDALRNLCYYSDLTRQQNQINTSYTELSKALSDYMLYLLIDCPFMLRDGIGEIRYRDTCVEAMRFFDQRKAFQLDNPSQPRMMLLQMETELEPQFVKGDRSKSVFDGCILAKSLQSLETEVNWENERKWEMISHVWMDLLVDAAIKCGWKHHARQLAKGGELITCARIIMAHLDWFATTSLGALSTNKGGEARHNENYTLQAFWAPFLLLHLGGPDTITAYSLEDNELWQRRLLELAVQVVIVVYVCFMSLRFTHNVITFLTVLVLVAGLIKYCERAWALWSSSYGHFRSSLLPSPDPGPDFAEFMEEYTRRNKPPICTVVEPLSFRVVREGTEDVRFIHEAHHLFEMLRRLYAGYILDFNEEINSKNILSDKSPSQVFILIEVEHGFMYDYLYTKATIIYSHLGILLRFVSFLCIVSAFWVFCLLVDRQPYSRTDVIITYLLLSGAIVLEIYAAILLFFSDWTVLWLTKHNKSWHNSIFRTIFPIWSYLNNRKRWSGSIAQHNLLTYCLEAKRHSKFEKAFKFADIFDTFIAYKCRTWQDVSLDLKKIVVEYVSQRPNDAQRGDYVLEIYGCKDKFNESTSNVDFDHSLLLWHIATDLCYYSDLTQQQNQINTSNAELSKALSDYMLYLLIECPFMLPDGIGEARYRDTCAEAMRFFEQRRAFQLHNPSQPRMMLLQVNTELKPRSVKGDRSKSVLFDGCILAKTLQSLETEANWENERKWEMVSHVWVDLLVNAAVQCGWKHHARQLTKGGELVTFARIIMAHLGKSERFMISAGCATVTMMASS